MISSNDVLQFVGCLYPPSCEKRHVTFWTLMTTIWILWMPISNDECMLLVPHRESQPADQSTHILSAPTAARPNCQVFFSPIPITLAAETCKVVQRRVEKSSCHRHQHRFIQYVQHHQQFALRCKIPAWQQHPTVSTVQPTFKIASTPTPSRSFANMSQAVQFCALLEKSPLDAFTGCSAPLGFKCVSRIKQTPSLTERSERTFLTGDLAGLFSK